MRHSIRGWLFACAGLALLIGCEVTAEKIELWKGTQNGPKKLAAALTDPELQLDLRAKAAVALVEINSWELFRESFKQLDKKDADSVILAAAPILAEMVQAQDPSGGHSLAKSQVDAKDALFILLDFAGGEGRDIAERALISWCVQDYNQRAMAGQYNIKTIVKKIGVRAAEGLVPLLTLDQIVIKYVAELIREVGDPGVLAKASSKLATELKQNPKKIKEVHLLSAAIIGGDPVGDILLEMATNKEIGAALQRFALRAFSEGLANKTFKLPDQRVEQLFSIAEDTEYDKFHREETYYVIAQAGRQDDVKRLRKMLSSKDSFWRAVGFRCLLRVDGEKQLSESLRDLAKRDHIQSEEDVEELVARITSFPKLLPAVRSLLSDPQAEIRGIAVNVIEKIGHPEDAKALISLKEDGARLPKGFKYKTVGEAAAKAAEMIKKRG